MTEEDDCEWDWALYSPQIYFHEVPYTGENIMIDKDFLDKNEIGLYMMEHYELTSELKLTDNSIEICGQADIDDDIL